MFSIGFDQYSVVVVVDDNDVVIVIRPSTAKTGMYQNSGWINRAVSLCIHLQGNQTLSANPTSSK